MNAALKKTNKRMILKDLYLILVEKKRRDYLCSRKSPRITKNINGYTKRMSLQKLEKKEQIFRQAKHQDWKEFTEKSVVSKFFAEAKEGERRVQKDEGQIGTTDIQ